MAIEIKGKVVKAKFQRNNLEINVIFESEETERYEISGLKMVFENQLIGDQIGLLYHQGICQYKETIYKKVAIRILFPGSFCHSMDIKETDFQNRGADLILE